MRPSLVIAVSMILGCASDPLSVRGEVVAVVDGISGGFEFEPRTDLVEPDPEEPNVAGECRIGGSEVFASVARGPASDVEAVVRSFAMRMDYEDAGEVWLSTADTVYSAESSSTCELTLVRASRSDATVALRFDCSVQNAEGERALVVGELSFAGCFVD